MCGVPFHHRILRTEVTGENQFDLFSVLLKPYFKICTSKNMSCIPTSNFDSRSYLENIIVTYGTQKLKGLLHIIFGIERLYRRKTLPEVLTGSPFRLFLHDVGGILPQNLSELHRRRGGKHLSPETAFHKKRNSASMIQMRVSKHHRINAIWSKGERGGVSLLLMSSLMKSEIHDHPAFADFKKIA
jgi:hypothetical protein